jgi:hypothetical protein
VTHDDPYVGADGVLVNKLGITSAGDVPPDNRPSIVLALIQAAPQMVKAAAPIVIAWIMVHAS